MTHQISIPLQLGLDADMLASCVSCGLCLPHCPTFRVTGEEAWSPRGRIAAMRAIQDDGITPDTSFYDSMDSCVMCRGCETACPSAVPFGRLMEQTREVIGPSRVPWWQRAGLAALAHPRLIRLGSLAAAVAQRLKLVPRRLGLPTLPVRRRPLVATGTDVWLFTGCVMDAWQRDVHQATLDVLTAAGVGAGPVSGGCCGALSAHAGLGVQARSMAAAVMAAIPGDLPILVNSAGCGAAMKDYGHLLGTEEANAFARRVFDIHEWLAERVDRLPQAPGKRPVVAVQDACHLRHVQRAHLPVRVLLRHVAEVVELDDEGLCCGAGGSYSMFHPGTAAAIRDRKIASIDRSGSHGAMVASANPGCMMHLRAAGVDARHPMEIIAEALGGRR